MLFAHPKERMEDAHIFIECVVIQLRIAAQRDILLLEQVYYSG